jgi:hypothetical protein
MMDMVLIRLCCNRPITAPYTLVDHWEFRCGHIGNQRIQFLCLTL